MQDKVLLVVGFMRVDQFDISLVEVCPSFEAERLFQVYCHLCELSLYGVLSLAMLSTCFQPLLVFYDRVVIGQLHRVFRCILNILVNCLFGNFPGRLSPMLLLVLLIFGLRRLLGLRRDNTELGGITDNF